MLYGTYIKYSCKKKRRSKHDTDHEMFKLTDVPGSFSDIINQRGTLGFRSRLTKKFTLKETKFDGARNTPKSKKKTKKEPVWYHDNIYDVDEVDSKFEGIAIAS